MWVGLGKELEEASREDATIVKTDAKPERERLRAGLRLAASLTDV